MGAQAPERDGTAWRRNCWDNPVSEQKLKCLPEKYRNNPPFRQPVASEAALQALVADFAARCGEDFQRQNGEASILTLFLQTNRFATDRPTVQFPVQCDIRCAHQQHTAHGTRSPLRPQKDIQSRIRIQTGGKSPTAVSRHPATAPIGYVRPR
jgi:hypothetical protein